ncbi:MULTISPECIES: nitrate reductase molybdenum cofactor assembly chaperone [Oceanobacillus]|uniref:Nitrate reductase molybdenum cofactor assembly chaperone n=1 Tax=Oceanobacillus aidingensis TaxID=645964 RepID=A0ABV9K1S3_9BACI|nr:nitrate reductase molybdenum cofactor assembly chaperone [Oceanobacillus oncorhynchi]MDM8101318.1 nitrate reductase molybdenum cofactor assembly chaperone [Oceanobacillus oncorhynchi]
MNPSIYQLISFLLTYPNQQMKEILPEIREEIEELSTDGVKENLQQFIHEVDRLSLDDWVAHYINHFDFGRLTNLYVTYLKLGEQRERGLELLKLKKYYEAHGFEVTDKELPDYLPLLLEFCAHVPVETSNEILDMHGKAIAEIQKKLQKENSFYHILFEALFIQMESHGLHVVTEDAI